MKYHVLEKDGLPKTSVVLIGSNPSLKLYYSGVLEPADVMEKVVVFYDTDPIPNDGIQFIKNFDPALKEQIVAAFLKMSEDEAGKKNGHSEDETQLFSRHHGLLPLELR